MDVAFIIAEYNPFHNGHKYHIKETRRLAGSEYIVSVMSGNFVQRGDIAICDKFMRAHAAVLGGADLVIELPIKYAVANASHFARGAVDTIRACGIPGILSFGSSASSSEIAQLNKIIFSEEFMQKTAELSMSGLAYPAAKSALLKKNGYEKELQMLKDPNNTLAAEYIKNIDKDDRIKPFSVSRIENMHDSAVPSDCFASAKYIRNAVYSEYIAHEGSFFDALSGYIPVDTLELLKSAATDGLFPSDRKKYEAAALSRLLFLGEKDYIDVDNVSRGLENKIVHAVKENVSLDGVFMDVKSKRFTLSRIRQIVTQAVLGIKKTDIQSDPSYLRVLAFNDKGRELLSTMRRSALLPVVTNLSDVSQSPDCMRDCFLEYAEDKLFDICLPVPKGGNRPFLSHPVYVKSVRT